MKKSPIEERLEAQELLRLQMLEQMTDSAERKTLLTEIELINKMRDMLEENRVRIEENRIRSKTTWIEAAIKTLGSGAVIIILAIFGFASEQLNGNPTGFTLKWLFNRAPR